MNEAARMLNRDLALALGLPKSTTRAVLTLQAGEFPRLEVVCHRIPLAIITTPDTGAQSLGSVQFMLRLEPFTPNEDPP